MTMNTMDPTSLPLTLTLDDYLASLDACSDARVWARDYATLEDAWTACERGDWLCWLLRNGKLADERTLARIACRIVRETPVYDNAGEPDGRTVWDLLTDERGRRAVETAERWVDGQASDAELATARREAWVAYADAAADAAYAYAAYAAYAASADAATYAASAAVADVAADAAAYAGSYRTALARVRRVQADIVRSIVPSITSPTTAAPRGAGGGDE